MTIASHHPTPAEALYAATLCTVHTLAAHDAHRAVQAAVAVAQLLTPRVCPAHNDNVLFSTGTCMADRRRVVRIRCGPTLVVLRRTPRGRWDWSADTQSVREECPGGPLPESLDAVLSRVRTSLRRTQLPASIASWKRLEAGVTTLRQVVLHLGAT